MSSDTCRRAPNAGYRAWAFENHPDEASRMWLAEWDNQVANTEESALLHLELGAEYVRLNS